MRLAYLDCSAGVSGDMYVGALIDAGVPLKPLQDAATALGVSARLAVSQVLRRGVTATKLDVSVGGQTDHYRPGLSHVLGFSREDEAATNPRDAAAAVPAPAQDPGMSLEEARLQIERLPITATASRNAVAILRTLAQAEAAVHQQDATAIRFHRLAMADALVDIICAAVGTDLLQVDGVLCSALNVGSGTVATGHGRFGVPTPVVAELVRGIPVYCGVGEGELVTPTGAAIVKTLASRFAAAPQLRVLRTGTGAGARDFTSHANVVRLLIGEAESAATTACG